MLPEGGAAAKEPRYACCVENALNLRPFLAGKADLVVTADKEGKHSGEAHFRVTLQEVPRLSLSLRRKKQRLHTDTITHFVRLELDGCIAKTLLTASSHYLACAPLLQCLTRT